MFHSWLKNKKTEFLVQLLPLFFPLYLIKFEFSGVPLNIPELIIYILFLAVLYGLITKKFNFNNFKKIDRLLLVAIFLLLIAAFLAVFKSPKVVTLIDGVTQFYGQKVALGILKSWIIAPILMFVVFLVVIKSVCQVLTMFNFYTISAFALSLWAIFQVVTNNYVTPDARASGPFESANYLALYITPAILYSLILIKENLTKGLRLLKRPQLVFLAGIFFILLLALIFSKSYAAMLALVLATGCYFGIDYWSRFRKDELKKRNWEIFIGLLTGLILLAVIVFAIDPAKWQNVFKFQAQNSSSVRVEVYAIASNLLKENWLTGIGLGQFPAQYQLQASRILGHQPYEWNMLHPHNIYLAFWLNLGVVGFLAFLLLIFISAKKTYAAFKHFPNSKIFDVSKIRVIFFTFLLIILIHGILDTPFFKNDLALLFWLILAGILLPLDDESINKN